MHKLMEYICDEIEDIERKAEKEGKLSAAEVQYLDTLAHTKKNLLKADEMWEESQYSEAGGNSMRGGSYARGGNGGSYRNSYDGGRGGSYARGRGGNARRDSRGRYSREGGYSSAEDDMEDMVMELKEMAHELPPEKKMEVERFIKKIEMM